MQLIRRGGERPPIRTTEVLRTEPESVDVPFDPERDITPEDISKVKTSIDYAFSAGEVFESTVNKIILLYITFPADTKNWPAMTYNRLKPNNPSYTGKNPAIFASEALAVKLYFPEELHRIPLKPKLATDLKAELRKLERSGMSNKWEHWLWAALSLKTLFPQDWDITLIDKQLTDLKEELVFSNGKELEGWGSRAALFRLLFPDEFSKIHITPEQLAQLKEYMEEGASRHSPQRIQLMHALFAGKVLTAAQAYVDNTGQVVISAPKKRLITSTRPLPHRSIN